PSAWRSHREIDRIGAVADRIGQEPVLVRVNAVVAQVTYDPLAVVRLRLDRNELGGHRIELLQGSVATDGLGGEASAQSNHRVAPPRLAGGSDPVDCLKPKPAVRHGPKPYSHPFAPHPPP